MSERPPFILRSADVDEGRQACCKLARADFTDARLAPKQKLRGERSVS